MTKVSRGAALVLSALALGLPAYGGADEATAVQAVEKLKGVVTRDAKQKGNPVVSVTLLARDVKDADLAALAGLKQVEILDLGFTPLSGPGQGGEIGVL